MTQKQLPVPARMPSIFALLVTVVVPLRVSMAPDLRESPHLLHGGEETLKDIVRGGALLERACPDFPTLTDEELEGIRHYIRKQAVEGATPAGH